MISDTTTIAELAEILRRNDLRLAKAEVGGHWRGSYAEIYDGQYSLSGHAPTLAAAISAALAKAGAR